MRANLPVAILLALCVAACSSEKSPEAVQKDVAKAEQKASTEVAKAEDTAVKDLNKAAAKVDEKVTEFKDTATKEAYDLAMANADGDHKIALANCEQYTGDQQKQCKDQVESDYAAAKGRAVAAAQPH